MTVDEAIAALSALPAEMRPLPLVLAVPPYGMAAEVRELRYRLPPELADIRYMPDAEGDVLISVGLVMLVTLSECSPPPET